MRVFTPPKARPRAEPGTNARLRVPGAPAPTDVLAKRPERPPARAEALDGCALCGCDPVEVGALALVTGEDAAVLRWLGHGDLFEGGATPRCCAGCRARVIAPERPGWELVKREREKGT